MSMKKIILFSFLILIFACNRVKEGTKNAIDKSAETAGKIGTDIVDKVGEGVKKSLQSTIVLSEKLKQDGLLATKINFISEKEANDNGISIYLIFDKNFSNKISITVFDEKGNEYGRTTTTVKGTKGYANYYDIYFDKRVNLENKSKFVIE